MWLCLAYVPEACIRLSSREPPFAGRPEFLRKCWPFRRPISCVRPCSSERLSCHSRLRPRDRNCNDKTDYVFILKTSFKKLKSTNMICGYFLYTDVWRLLGIPWPCFVDVFFWATIFANLVCLCYGRMTLQIQCSLLTCEKTFYALSRKEMRGFAFAKKFLISRFEIRAKCTRKTRNVYKNP